MINISIWVITPSWSHGSITITCPGSKTHRELLKNQFWHFHTAVKQESGVVSGTPWHVGICMNFRTWLALLFRLEHAGSVFTGWSHPNGEIHPCQFIQLPEFRIGSIRKHPFSELWSDPENPVLKMFREKKEHRTGKCRSCSNPDLCGGGYRARRYWQSGDFSADDPFCFIEQWNSVFFSDFYSFILSIGMPAASATPLP